MTSPSSLGREVECLASVVLPHSKSIGPRAIRGRDLHAYLCAHAKATNDEERAEALEEVPLEWRPAAAAIDFTRLPALAPETGVPEMAMAWNPATDEVRELGRGGSVEHDDIDELLRPGEMGGIIDWCALTPDGLLIVDFKFGWATFERAEANHQTFAYSVMATKLLGRSRATTSLARILDNGSVWADVAAMDELRIDAAEAKIRQHLKKAEQALLAYRSTGVIPTPHEGGHCRYCPAQNSCPAKVALLLSVLAGEDGKAQVLATLPEPLTQEAVVLLWPKLQQASKLIERLTENVKDVVRIWGPVKLANGKVLADVDKPFETIHPEWARPVLKARFGELAVEGAIKTEETLTKKSLDSLLQDHSSHGGKAKLKRAVMDELEEAGAIRTVVKRGVEEVAADSKKLKATEEQKALADGQS